MKLSTLSIKLNLIFTLSTVAASVILSSCNQYGKVSYKDSPQVINVSSYDPKEVQRGGKSYTPLDQSNLRRNGALGQIARCSKGYTLDSKCSDFLVGAERQNMLLGTYHYLQPYSSATAQANLYLNRLQTIKRTRGLQTDRILLVADIDTKCSVAHMITFVTHIKNRTGVYPLIYIENGEGIRARLRNASSRQKRILKKCPYWLALYSNKYPGISTPQALIKATNVWSTWSLWQYGGVEWERGRSVSKHYEKGSWDTPKYFGNMSRPMERNGFNGSKRDLYQMWKKHSWEW